jgi:hypothetical protein
MSDGSGGGDSVRTGQPGRFASGLPADVEAATALEAQRRRVLEAVVAEVRALLDQARLLSEAVVSLDIERVSVAAEKLAVATADPPYRVAEVTHTYAALRRAIIDHAPNASTPPLLAAAQDTIFPEPLAPRPRAEPLVDMELRTPNRTTSFSRAAAGLRATGAILVLVGIIWAVSRWLT